MVNYPGFEDVASVIDYDDVCLDGLRRRAERLRQSIAKMEPLMAAYHAHASEGDEDCQDMVDDHAKAKSLLARALANAGEE